MKTLVRIGIVAIVACLPAAAVSNPVSDLLEPDRISSARVNLNPRGAQLGFELVIPGDDPGLEALVEVIRGAEPGGGHRCANAGAIRFSMEDGGRVGIGLLPGHEGVYYGLRLYDGDNFVGTFRVERATLLAVLEELGLPMNDPAFRE